MVVTFACSPIHLLMKSVKEKLYDAGGHSATIELRRFNAER